jgi:hypothetical protein
LLFIAGRGTTDDEARMIVERHATSQALQVLVLGAGSVQRARWVQELGHDPLWLGFEWWDNVSPSSSFESGERERWLAQQLQDSDRLAGVVICADQESSLDLAGRCLDAGIRAVLIHPPFSPSQHKLEYLAERSGDAIVMVSCSLRFSFKLPRFDWSLLELTTARSRPRWRSRVSMLLAGALPTFDHVYDELDLAYSVNGPIKRIATMRRDHFVRVGIEHANSSYTELHIDRSGLGGPMITAMITAYDDGTALHVLREPMRLQAPRCAEPAQIAELKHFLDCVAAGGTPCNTLNDATHVHNWTLEIATAFQTRS